MKLLTDNKKKPISFFICIFAITHIMISLLLIPYPMNYYVCEMPRILLRLCLTLTDIALIIVFSALLSHTERKSIRILSVISSILTPLAFALRIGTLEHSSSEMLESITVKYPYIVLGRFVLVTAILTAVYALGFGITKIIQKKKQNKFPNINKILNELN